MPSFLQEAQSWFTPQQVLVLVLTLSRVSGMMMIAPVFGSVDVPLKVRGLFAVSLALIMLPVNWQTSVPAANTMLDFFTYVGTEVILGFALGAGVWLLLTGVQLGGMLVSQASGLSLADVFNPSLDSSTPVLGHFLYLLALVIFLCIGGHRALIAGLLESFSTVPLGQSPLTLLLPEMLSEIVSQSFSLAVRVAAPGVAALLLATVVLGLIGRALPQLNITTVGVGLNSMLAAGVLALSLGSISWVFQDELEPVLQKMFDTIGTQLPDDWLG